MELRYSRGDRSQDEAQAALHATWQVAAVSVSVSGRPLAAKVLAPWGQLYLGLMFLIVKGNFLLKFCY